MLNENFRYLICAKYGTTGCHARANLPLNAPTDQLKVTRNHNHPPDDTIEEKFMFYKQLKEATQSSINSPLKVLFDGVLSMFVYFLTDNILYNYVLYFRFPKVANEVNFESIRTSMRRWRKEVVENK